ncbi:MAG: hypothetical protein U9R06_01445 [Patescibacteria group bacterium]|nr:hypothetical protein [Patescibacteria group bacterium]
MSQKIKKQIKRSMPVFVIVSLLASTAAIGLVFNFELNFYNPIKKDFGMSLSVPAAQADDYASTTVQVRNAPPSITNGPAESPTSTSTSPINAGDDISFTVTATDDEGNDYYIAVCKTDSITASTTGGAPECAASQELCVSTKVNTGVQNTCVHTNVASDVGETQEWYVFVCDDHGSEGSCSNASQGAGFPASDGGSPFYINHAPTINTATTSLNNLVPGGTFEVAATSTDTDILGGANELTMHICSTASYSTTTGCDGTEYCTATGTASSPGASTTISCQWTDSAPTAHGDYDYYVYIKDEFGLAGTNNGINRTYTIINIAPDISNIKLVPNLVNDIQLNIKDAGGTIVYATSTSAQDNNGCDDLVSATGTIYWSNASGENVCTADDNDCYQMTSTACAITDCVGAIAKVSCTSTIEYHAQPTDASSNVAATYWLAAITIWDEDLYDTATTTAPGTDIKTGEAFEITETEIDYGQLVAGTNSGTSTATTTITNFGNCPIDSEISGEWMTQAPSYVIDEQWQEYSTTTNFQWGGTVSFDLSSTTPGALTGLVAPRPTTTASDQIDYLYWGMGIPAGQFSGTYNGENLFVVKIDSDGNWN